MKEKKANGEQSTMNGSFTDKVSFTSLLISDDDAGLLVVCKRAMIKAKNTAAETFAEKSFAILCAPVVRESRHASFKAEALLGSAREDAIAFLPMKRAFYPTLFFDEFIALHLTLFDEVRNVNRGLMPVNRWVWPGMQRTASSFAFLA